MRSIADKKKELIEQLDATHKNIKGSKKKTEEIRVNTEQ